MALRLVKCHKGGGLKDVTSSATPPAPSFYLLALYLPSPSLYVILDFSWVRGIKCVRVCVCVCGGGGGGGGGIIYKAVARQFHG